MNNRNNTNNTNNTVTITQIALFTALQCVISPFAIVLPFSPVPISLATLMMYISIYILGKKNSLISCGMYLLIGFVGLPVFSGFTGGIGKILGPTGGYLLGYLLIIFIGGNFIEKWSCNKKDNNKNSGVECQKQMSNKYKAYFIQAFGLFLGTAVCYAIGCLWLMFQTKISFTGTVITGVVPFLPGDVIKIFAGVMIGSNIRKRLLQAGIL